MIVEETAITEVLFGGWLELAVLWSGTLDFLQVVGSYCIAPELAVWPQADALDLEDFDQVGLVLELDLGLDAGLAEAVLAPINFQEYPS